MVNPPYSTERALFSGGFVNAGALPAIGFTVEAMSKVIMATYRLLDRLDVTLGQDGVEPLCQIVELANLSSMVGNVLAAEMVKHSGGLYCRNGPHKFPDLLPNAEGAAPGGVEIKMALNRNKPKGHLVKPGHYVTCRYVLVDREGNIVVDPADRARSWRPVIWEMRTGYLDKRHFNVSNTEGDSGKTAVVNEDGMLALKVVYVDLGHVPGSRKGATWREYSSLVAAGI